jgi:type IV pilus assembly PilX-like protein
MIDRPSMRAHEQGIALVCVLMVTTLLATLSAALVLVVMSETMASANHAAGQQALYAADAGLECTIAELRTADWPAVPAAAVSAKLWDGALAPRTPDGSVLNLGALAALRQADSDVVFAPSPNRPIWHLFGHGPFADLVPAGLVTPAAYLLIWVADDGEEEDGEGLRDSNGVLLVRVEAFGASGAHRAIEAAVALETVPGTPLGAIAAVEAAPGLVRHEVRVVSWREMR